MLLIISIIVWPGCHTGMRKARCAFCARWVYTCEVIITFCNKCFIVLFWLTFVVFQTREKQARTKSAELLKKELENEENLGSTEYLTKVRSFDCFDFFRLFVCLFSRMTLTLRKDTGLKERFMFYVLISPFNQSRIIRTGPGIRLPCHAILLCVMQSFPV